MPRDLTHAVLEGLDEAKSTGGLVIMKKKKKEGGEEEKGGFKLPVGPSKLGLDRCEPLRILGVCKDFVPLRLAAAKEKERRNQELKDALEESERKMQEVKFIAFADYHNRNPFPYSIQVKNARKRQVEEEREEEEARKIQRKEREGKQFRESRVETPSHTGGVSEEALKREEERRNKGGRGLKVKFSQ